MRASRIRLLIWAGIAITIVAGLAFLFRPVPERVDLVTVGRDSLVVTVDDEGETRVRDVFLLSSPVAGQARRIILEPGDRVIRNETLITEIEPRDADFLNPRSEAQAQAEMRAAESALTLAEAEVERAQSELDFAAMERGRARELIVDNNISQRALDDAERAFRSGVAALNTARAGLQVRRFELERARASLIMPSGVDSESGAGCLCIPVTAPVDGSILRVLHESAGVVEAGEPLAEIGDPSALEIVVDLLSSDAVRVRPGQNVVIEEWGGPRPLQGVVRRVEPFGFTRVSSLGIEEQRVNVIIDFDRNVDDATQLGHGYRVVTQIELARAEAALTVPLTSLFRDGEQWSVFVEQDGRARLVHVTIGKRNALAAEIVDGLAEGEQIVAYPSLRISDGTRIAAR